MKKTILVFISIFLGVSCSNDDGQINTNKGLGVFEVIVTNRNPEMDKIRGLVQSFGVSELSNITNEESKESSQQGLSFDFNKSANFKFKTEDNSNGVAASLNFQTSKEITASYTISFYFDGELKGTVEKVIETPNGFFQFGEGYDISPADNFRINTKKLTN